MKSKFKNLFRIYQMELFEVHKTKKVIAPNDISFKVADQRDISEVIKIREGKVKKDFLSNQENGAVCLVAKHKDIIVGYGWLKRKGCKDNFVKIRSNIGYLSSFYVKDDFRGRGIYPMLIAKLTDIAASQDAQKCLIAIQKKNKSSKNGLKKIKYTKQKEFLMLRMFKISFFKEVI